MQVAQLHSATKQKWMQFPQSCRLCSADCFQPLIKLVELNFVVLLHFVFQHSLLPCLHLAKLVHSALIWQEIAWEWEWEGICRNPSPLIFHTLSNWQQRGCLQKCIPFLLRQIGEGSEWGQNTPQASKGYFQCGYPDSPWIVFSIQCPQPKLYESI